MSAVVAASALRVGAKRVPRATRGSRQRAIGQGGQIFATWEARTALGRSQGLFFIVPKF
jgi:hypothetical protein